MSTTLSIDAGTYCSEQTLQFNASDKVDFVSYTVNGKTPTMSEYIAYDTLSPPNPFIAVTQDGLGNVVYDGGFPKFYNTYAPAAGTPFSQLSASFKFLYNAINFTANRMKPKRILILGDAAGTEHYTIKGQAVSDFYISFTRLCAIAGYAPTFKDRNDYVGGLLNPSDTELQGYACVLLMSSVHSGIPRITDDACKSLVAFREGGSGLIVVTDHGVDIGSFDAALDDPAGFFCTANKLIVDFGAYFTGNFDRVPVNVGFLRSNYGDHPLYANLDNSESIHAGGSESKVVVTKYPRYKPGSIPAVEMYEGSYHVQVLTRMKDGTIQIRRYRYTITGEQLTARRRMLVRETANSPWVDNFSKGGWQVYVGPEDPNAKCKQGASCEFFKMLPTNTVVRSADNKSWERVK